MTENRCSVCGGDGWIYDDDAGRQFPCDVCDVDDPPTLDDLSAIVEQIQKLAKELPS